MYVGASHCQSEGTPYFDKWPDRTLPNLACMNRSGNGLNLKKIASYGPEWWAHWGPLRSGPRDSVRARA